jgi:hypothetical protein
MNPAPLEPRRHAPPDDWSSDVFDRVTAALAAALVAALEPEEAAAAPRGRALEAAP